MTMSSVVDTSIGQLVTQNMCLLFSAGNQARYVNPVEREDFRGDDSDVEELEDGDGDLELTVNSVIESDSSADSDDNDVSEELQAGKSKEFVWKKGDFNPQQHTYVANDEETVEFIERDNWLPIDYVNEYLTPGTFSEMVNCTNQTSVMVTGKSVNITNEEM